MDVEGVFHPAGFFRWTGKTSRDTLTLASVWAIHRSETPLQSKAPRQAHKPMHQLCPPVDLSMHCIVPCHDAIFSRDMDDKKHGMSGEGGKPVKRKMNGLDAYQVTGRQDGLFLPPVSNTVKQSKLFLKAPEV